MHPADIKAAIEKAGSSQTAIAAAMNTNSTVVNHVIYGRSASRRIATHIAEVTGLSLDMLWPGRYPEKDSTEGKKLTRNRQKHHPSARASV